MNTVENMVLLIMTNYREIARYIIILPIEKDINLK